MLSLRQWIALGLVFAVVTVLAIWGNAYHQGLLVTACVFTILGLSLNLVYGYLGYISFGHAAFLGLSAYTAGLLTLHFDIPFWAAALIATVPSAMLGALIGYAALRIGGAYFAIASLTAAEILRLVAENWIDLTRGPMGIIVSRPRIAFLEGLGLNFNQYYLLIAVVVTLLCYLAVAFVMRGPVGRAWIAVRESADLAESLGISTTHYRVLNLTLSGFLAGVAGAIMVPRIVVLTPDLFGTVYSATGLLIVVLGGKAAMIGPLIGGALFAGLPELLRVIDDYRLAIFALLLIVFIRLIPTGIAPLMNFYLGGRRTLPRKPTDWSLAPQSAESRAKRTVLEVSGLTKRYSGLTALQDVSFRIEAGELVGLMGPNGAGKSTCLGLLSGFIPATEGRVRFNGEDITGMQPNMIARRGLVRTFQHATLFEGLCVFDNVLAGAHLAAPRGLGGTLPGNGLSSGETARQKRAWQALRVVGLEGRANDMPKDLPYGEQRLLSLSIAIAAGPTLLLLDEPAAGLNPVEAENLANILRRLRDYCITVLLIEHNVRMMAALCDRIVVIHHGQKIGEGSAAEVQADPAVREAYFGEVADA